FFFGLSHLRKFKIKMSLIGDSHGILCNFIVPNVNGGIKSTGCIVARLCLRHSDTIAQGFYACYDQAPGKAQFEQCQRQAFGTLLNTDAAVVATCRNAFGLVRYVQCLGPAFSAAGINQADAVTRVNRCQGRLLGLNVSGA
ncbi:unnamed protein product, partial [Allacma fusca]